MDWADERASMLMEYLNLCSNRKDQRELLAAYLRRERSEGKVIAVEEMQKEFAR